VSRERGDETLTPAPERSAAREQLRRAAPRLTGTGVGLALIAGSDGGPTIAIGITVFVLSVMTNPVRWWRHVTTGDTGSPDAGYVEPGTCGVRLESPGRRPIEVVKALREVTSADLATAKAQVDGAPTRVVGGLSAASADRVRSRLEAAGASASVDADPADDC
jgi:hypothetical protein